MKQDYADIFETEEDWFYFYGLEHDGAGGLRLRVSGQCRGRSGPVVMWPDGTPPDDLWAEVEFTVNSTPRAAKGTERKRYRIYRDRHEEITPPTSRTAPPAS
jgi:hypothetical protein